MSTPAQVWEYRNLIANLARRDLKARYKRSFIGWLWSLINPATQLGIYTFVFGVILGAKGETMGSGRAGIFALYLFCGLVVWNLFFGAINACIGAFAGAGALLTRTYFPAECPLVAVLGTVFLQAILEAFILVAFMIVVGNIGPTTLLIIPVLLCAAAAGFGIGMVVAALNIRFRDVGYLLNIGLQVWFYATPIVWPITLLDSKPEIFQRIIRLNPLTHVVYLAQESCYMLANGTLLNWAVAVGFAVLCLGIGWWVFDRYAPRVIEEL